MTRTPYKTPESELAVPAAHLSRNARKEKLNDRLIMAVLLVLIVCKLFGWGLIGFGFLIFDENDLISANMYKLVHFSSYQVVSSLLVIGIFLYTRLALLIYAATIPINFLIYYVNGTQAYQSILDPVLLVIFILLVIARKPNSWSNKITLTSTSK